MSKSSEGVVVWLTGISGAGKSTLSDKLKSSLAEQGIPSIQIDGDGLRSGLCTDLGFAPEARDENIRRAAEVAKLASGQGFLVLCSLITPLAAHRDLARRIVGDAFIEVFVDCTVESAIERDPKGLYERALKGEIPNFTGISAPYEAPVSPEVHVRTSLESIEQSLSVLRLAVLNRYRRQQEAL